jgi:CrcB protein
MALVFLGGAAGTGVRFGLGAVVPFWRSVPVATFGINVVGAFLLGALLERLERLGRPRHDPDRVRRLRLLIGTGGLGGFTTYSSLATDTASLLLVHPGRAVGYAVGTLLVGTVASVAGIWVARRAAGGAEPSASVAR